MIQIPYPGDLFTKAVLLHYDPVYYYPADLFFGFLDYQIFHPTPPTVMMIGPAYDTTIALSAQNLPVITFQETHTQSTANITWSNGPTINTAEFFSQMGADTAIDVTVYASNECGDTVSMSDEIIFTKDMLDHFVVTANPDTIIHNASSTITIQAQDVNNNNIAIPDETELTITFDPGNLGTPSILMFDITAKRDKHHSVDGALNQKLKVLNKSATIQGNDDRLMRTQHLVEKKGAVNSDRTSSAGSSFNAQRIRSISKPQTFSLPTAGSITCIYAEANGGSLVYNADGVEPAQNQTVQITATKTDDGNKKGAATITVKGKGVPCTYNPSINYHERPTEYRNCDYGGRTAWDLPIDDNPITFVPCYNSDKNCASIMVGQVDFGVGSIVCNPVGSESPTIINSANDVKDRRTALAAIKAFKLQVERLNDMIDLFEKNKDNPVPLDLQIAMGDFYCESGVNLNERLHRVIAIAYALNGLKNYEEIGSDCHSLKDADDLTIEYTSYLTKFFKQSFNANEILPYEAQRIFLNDLITAIGAKVNKLH